MIFTNGKSCQAIFIDSWEVISFSTFDWVLTQVKSDTAFGKALLNQKILKIWFNCLRGKLEIGVLRVSQYVVKKACECNDQLTNQSSNYIDTVLLGIGVSDIVDFSIGGMEVF